MLALEYLVIAECPLKRELRVNRFGSRELAQGFGNEHYGQKWDWTWEVKPVFTPPTPVPLPRGVIGTPHKFVWPRVPRPAVPPVIHRFVWSRR